MNTATSANHTACMCLFKLISAFYRYEKHWSSICSFFFKRLCGTSL